MEEATCGAVFPGDGRHDSHDFDQIPTPPFKICLPLSEFTTNLSGVDLSEANLSGVNLRGVDLRGVNLSSTNLSEANLSSANLSEANLSSASLRRTNLMGANLRGVSLSHANLSDVSLSSASLDHANLGYANLGYANLGYANLDHANLSHANLSHANLTGANFNRTVFRETLFAWVDLSLVKELETARHDGPSVVDINSVVVPTDEPIRLHFLRGVGFSDTAIEYLPSILTPSAIQYSSLFIGYANPDETLAYRLYRNLQDKGVRCWMAPHDLRPGDYHHSRIDEAIHLHEKVLLLLSEHAVNSPWVKHEVQIAEAREIKQDRIILFPLRLDKAVMQTSKDWAVKLRESRHIGDFTGWQDESAYNRAFTTLLQHLKVTRL